MNRMYFAFAAAMLVASSALFPSCDPCMSRDERKMRRVLKTMSIIEFAKRKNNGKIDESLVNSMIDFSVKYNLDLNRPIDDKGKTLLMYAAETGHLTPIRTLRKQGVNMNAKDNKGYTALDYARANVDQRTVDYLKKYGACKKC